MNKRRGIWLCFWAYILLMLWLLFFQRIGDSAGMDLQTWLDTSVNLVPGRTIGNLCRGAWNGWYYRDSTFLLRFAIINNLGNILMFVPLGWLLPSLWQRQRRWGWFLLTVTGSILVVETVQLLTMLGSWDVDDLLLNVAGASIGAWLWKRRKKRKTTGNSPTDML